MHAAALAPSLSLSHSLSLSLSFLPLPLSCSAFLESFPLWFLGCLLVISIQYEMVVVLYVDIILNKQKKIMYMYTHIELWLSSVLLLLKEKRRGPTSGGDSAGNMTFKWLYTLPLMPTWFLHLPIYDVLFLKFVLFFFLNVTLPALGVWVEVTPKTKTPNRTEHNLLPCQTLCVAGQYLMYI